MKLLYAEETYKVRQALFTVYNVLGFGHKEEVYQKALAKEFDSLRIEYRIEANLQVFYKNEIVGFYRPDFVIKDKIIIELKAVDFMPKTFETQLLHYLKSTNFQLGLLVNFGSPTLIIKRLILTDSRKSENKSV